MTYGKIHRSLFDSSINEADPATRWVFVGMFTLSDHEGRLDITREALRRKVNVTAEDVNRALDYLSQPDPESRTADYEGRRIIPIDPARSWGWIVVNKEKYRHGDPDEEAIRASARERKRRQRERDKLSLSNVSSLKEASLSLAEEKEKHTPSVTSRVTSRNVTKVTRDMRDATFERLWLVVPRKEGKRDARKHFEKFVNAAVANTDSPEAAFTALVSRIERAIQNYASHHAAKGTEPRYLMQGSRLFLNFDDYVSGDWMAAPERQSRARRLSEETERLMQGETA